MPTWHIACDVDDAVAITIGRTVAPSGDLATDEECRQWFARALPQFMARAVAARYAAALDTRAAARANDLASAVVVEYPEGYEPDVAPQPLNAPPGPAADFLRGPAADPSAASPVPDPTDGGVTG